jgi:hypothetical protein
MPAIESTVEDCRKKEPEPEFLNFEGAQESILRKILFLLGS